jgi:predicted PurR-regulated permease PerM
MIQIVCLVISVSATILVAFSLIIIKWLREDIAKVRQDLKDFEDKTRYREHSIEENRNAKEIMSEAVDKIQKFQAEQTQHGNKQGEIIHGLNHIIKILTEK